MDQFTQDVQTAVVKVREKWHEDNLKDPKVLAAKVHQHLDGQVETILGQLLGFDMRNGRWEIDHCNGRSGESVAGNFIKEVVSKATASWLLDQIVPLPKLTKSQVNAMQREFQNKYQDKVRSQLYELCEKKARQDAEHIFERLIKAGNLFSLPLSSRETT
jgi:hypothetical protein